MQKTSVRSFMVKSIVAVVAGYAVMAVLVIITTMLAAAFLLNDSSEVTSSYLVVNLILSLISAVVGGWVTAKLAPNNKKRHVQMLAGLIVVLGLLSLTQTVAGQPAWYPWVIMLIGAAGALYGGSYYEKKNA
jgi:uncharacterized BrkB/YihY/UPF0761 family membrane protein